MGKRRGFFAEMQYQQRLAEQRQRREYAAAVEAHIRAQREAERAQREHQRAAAAALRSASYDQRMAAASAMADHKRAQLALAESLSAQATEAFEQIDSILSATLEVDDHIDIDSLKVTARHPPFAHDDLKKPIPEPKLEKAPQEPKFVVPPPPTGLSKVFGKQKYADETARAEAAWTKEHNQWLHFAQQVLPKKNAKLLEEHAAAEQQRADRLNSALGEYRNACAERDREAAQTNERLENFKQALASGDPEAINQYIGMVLSNSAYPEHFAVEHDYQFDPDLRELTVTVHVPPPSSVPNVKAYKYVPASDAIRETSCTQKEQRERYNNAVAAVAIRTFHEVFESDREERVQTISLTVQTDAINPATGLVETYVFVSAAADRQEFLLYDLRNVDPAQTLTLARALVSKNAFALKPISAARGIR